MDSLKKIQKSINFQHTLYFKEDQLNHQNYVHDL
jgi:hypothetical protein